MVNCHEKIICWLTKENLNTALFIYGQDMKMKLLTGPLPGRIDVCFDFQKNTIVKRHHTPYYS